MCGHSISDIARALACDFQGDGDITISIAAEPASASADQLAVAMDPKYSDDLRSSDARAAILWDGADWQGFGLKAAIMVARPRLAMAALTNHLKSGDKPEQFVHPTAIIEPGAVIGDGASIGAYAVIAGGVQIGAGATIGTHVSIAEGARIGEDCEVDSGSRIGKNVVIGDRFVAHCGVVIGADGFSFVTTEKSALEDVRQNLGGAAQADADQAWLKIQSLGGVEIGDDVEIGANSSVDAGTIRPTKIGVGTKIDALVQVGHNVRIGRNCLLCAHVAVGGSASLGNGVVLGGQAGVADNIAIGDGVVAGGASKILSNVPKGRAILGYPATKMEAQVENYKLLRRLPRILDALKKRSEPGAGK